MRKRGPTPLTTEHVVALLRTDTEHILLAENMTKLEDSERIHLIVRSHREQFPKPTEFDFLLDKF